MYKKPSVTLYIHNFVTIVAGGLIKDSISQFLAEVIDFLKNLTVHETRNVLRQI